MVNRKLYHDLKRRINQQAKQKNLDDKETLTNIKFECINTLALSWPDTIENIMEKQNVGNYVRGTLSDEKLLIVGSLLEDSTAVPVMLVLEHFEIDKKHECTVMKWIIRLFPVMHNRISQSITVNLWQTEFTMKEFEDYTITDDESPEKENTERSILVVWTFDLSLFQIIKVSDQGLLSLIFQIVFIAFFLAKGLSYFRSVAFTFGFVHSILH